MCRLKSGIILKDDIFVPGYDSHTEMLEEMKIKDTRKNAESLFVRAELCPTNEDIFTEPETWTFHVDQDIRPDWFVEPHERDRFVKAVRKWWEAHVFVGKDDLELPAGATYYLKNCKNAIVRSATVKAMGSATVKACGSATVEAWGSATVEAWGSATVKAMGSATVKAWGSATVKAWDSATVEAWGSTTVKAWGSTTVKAWGSATVEAMDSATVEAMGSATVVIPERSSNRRENILVLENSTLIQQNCGTRKIWASGDFEVVVSEDQPPKEVK